MSAWETDTGFELASGYLGVLTPASELYEEIAKQGWEILKVDAPKQSGFFEATARNPHGEKEKGVGPTASDALSNLLMTVMRTNFIRAASVRTATWGSDWTKDLAKVAEAYAKAPIYDPKAAGAWSELAQDSVRRAQVLQTQLKIEVVDAPEPYANAQEMCEDIHKNKHFYVSRANSHHPIWTVDQNVAFRIVHDVLGHCVSGGDFGWAGENKACAAHFPLLSANAQKALFTECVGQTAYGAYYRSFGPQKVAFLNEFIEPAQAQENSSAHTGVHPSQSVAPTATPQVAPSLSEEQYGGQPEHYVAPHQEALGLTRVMTRRQAAIGRDPNAGWSSGVEPLPDNGFHWHGDPLDAHSDGGMLDTAAKVDTKWHTMDMDTAKQAITNAFRVVLLSPRKDLKWNAIHYQHIMSVPASVDNPKRYWDALEGQRESWNQARGYAPGSHKPYWKAERTFFAYVRSMNHDLSEEEARKLAEREWREIWNDEEERIALDPKNQKLSADEVERKVAKDIERRVLTLLKPNENETTDVPHDQISLFAAVSPEQIDIDGNQAGKYGAWMGTHLKAVAQISRYADLITKAALKDIENHDGSGHHFRSTVLSLEIPGVGPKVCSFAWLLLQPLTSQLATIDTHMMDVLGHSYDKEMSDRDYFKFERELAAGRDAAGYGHVPLGAFQWGMWDHKRTGPGSHQDHSAMRVLDPVPHDQIDWGQKATNLKGDDWAKAAPPWWQATEPARKAVGDHWDKNVATKFRRDAIPELRTASVTAAGEDNDDEFCIAFQIPHEVKNKIANWASQLDLDGELEDPESYHCTVLYSPAGWHDESHHDWVKQYPLNGLPMSAWKLELFGPEEDTLVLRLKSDETSRWAVRLMDEAEERGLEISRFDGGYKPHITIAKGVSSIPDTDPFKLKFRSGPLFLYDPRPLQDDAETLYRQVIANSVRAPWFIDEEGNVNEGEPGHSLMHHLRGTLGLSTQDIWALDHEVGKR